MSGQPCKGFLGFFSMKRALRRPVSRDASGGCGYFPRGQPHVFRTVPDSAQPSRHGVKSRTYRYFFSFSRKCFRNFWTFGATTAWQYGWRGLRAKYSWW